MLNLSLFILVFVWVVIVSEADTDVSDGKSFQNNAKPAPKAKPSPKGPISPKVLLMSAFSYEAGIWLDTLGLSVSIPVAGLSTIYPNVLCNVDLSICLMVTGEGLSNAGPSVMVNFKY